MRLNVTITQDDETTKVWSLTKFLEYLGGIVRARNLSLTITTSDGTVITASRAEQANGDSWYYHR